MYRSAPTDRIYIFVLLSFFLLPTDLYAFQQDDGPVKVRLLRDYAPRTIIISSTKTATLYSGDPTNPIAELRSKDKLTLTTSNNQVYLKGADGGIYARSLIIDQPADAELTIELVEAKSRISPRKYRGAFMFQVDPSTPSTLNIINEVAIDDYVKSVLAGEFNFRELEASKALAVCIRTQAYQAIANQHGPGYAIPDNEMWQVYQGTQQITKTVRAAVDETRGEVLRFNNDLVEAVFFASSGGHTANHEDVWDANKILPYLRGKDDPYDYNSPNHSWESTIQRNQLLRALSDKFRFRVEGIKILDRSRDGRVRTMGIMGPNGQEEPMQSNAFRMLVVENFGRESLKSTLFDINVQPALYIFSGKGYGHGVGLNQWGALQLSKKGNQYDEILAYYYEGIEIDRGGIVSRLMTSTEQLIENTRDYFYDPEDEYSPDIPEISTISNESPTFTTEAGATDGISNRLYGDEEEAAQNDRRSRRRKDRANTDTRNTTKKTARPRTRGKRIGW